MKHPSNALYRSLCLTLLAGCAVAADWTGLDDVSAALDTDRYSFDASRPDSLSGNKNYYDGDFADYDGDGLIDRSLGSRYGLLRNSGAGVMLPSRAAANFMFRGVDGENSLGEDAFQWADVDNDGDYDCLSGGNGETLLCQENVGGTFVERWRMTGGNPTSALNIVNTDVDGDGFVDLLVSHAFCAVNSCGGPITFALLVNDGTGRYSDQASLRGLPYNGNPFNGNGHIITGSVSADFDGDGDFDVFLSHGFHNDPSKHYLILGRNDGNGFFTPEIIPGEPLSTGFNQSMTVGDVDDDGDMDVLVVHGWHVAGTIPHSLYINDGNGGFTDQGASRFHLDGYDPSGHPDGGLSASAGKLVDLDYDGDLDLVAFERGNAANGHGPDAKFIDIYRNDGSGHFHYDAAHSVMVPGRGTGLGLELDIADIDGDGVYDVWAGGGGETTIILRNLYQHPGGQRPDLPQSVRVVSTASSAITLGWRSPAFASSARAYRVYRSTDPALTRANSQLIAFIGANNQDEAFAAGIDRHSSTADLRNPDASIVSGEIRFTDRNVTTGTTYYYAITHIGAENCESPVRAQVSATASGGTPTNLAPQANAGADQSVTDTDLNGSQSVSLNGSGSSDSDGSIGSWSWRSGGSIIATGATPSVTLPVGSHSITLTVTDDDGATDTDVVVVTVVAGTPANVAPQANAGADQSVTDTDLDGSQSVSLNGSGSSDSDGSIASWSWRSGGSVIATGATPSVTLPVGSHSITLTVTDDDGATDTDVVVVTVVAGTPANVAPQANAGADQSVTDADLDGSQSVSLNGSGSSDSDGSIASWSWRSGGSGSVIATGATPSVTLPVGSHSITLTVTDDDGATDTDVVVVNVVAGTPANVAPQANAGADQSVTDSDGNRLQSVSLDGSASNDSDGSIVSYVWRNGSTQIASGATPTVTLAVGSHTIHLTVTDDDGATASDSVIIQVTSATPSQGPFGGTARTIVSSGSSRIEVEDYDLGGEGVAYHDTNPSNSGGQYRSDGVDIGTTSDSGGGHCIGWVAAGEWLEYTVDIASAGSYDLIVRVASGQSSDKNLHLELDGLDVSGAVTFNTGGAGWGAYRDVRVSGIALPAGRHVLRLVAGSSEFNINWLEFSPAIDQPPVVDITAPGSGAAVSGTISASALAYDPDIGTSDGDGVATVVYALLQGGSVVASHQESQAPYTWSLDTSAHANGDYTLRATVTATSAAGGGSTSDSIPLSIANGNTAPTANAGADQSVVDQDGYGAASVALHGGASSDADGSIVSYVWSVNGSHIASGATPSVTLPVGSHSITLTVTDEGGLSDSDQVIVTVLPRRTIVIGSGAGGPIWSIVNPPTAPAGTAVGDDTRFDDLDSQNHHTLAPTTAGNG